MDVYLETGLRKSFACAFDWPGYCRGAKTDDEALEALARRGDRYLAAVGTESGFSAPSSAKDAASSGWRAEKMAMGPGPLTCPMLPAAGLAGFEHDL